MQKQFSSIITILFFPCKGFSEPHSKIPQQCNYNDNYSGTSQQNNYWKTIKSNTIGHTQHFLYKINPHHVDLHLKVKSRRNPFRLRQLKFRHSCSYNFSKKYFELIIQLFFTFITIIIFQKNVPPAGARGKTTKVK